MTNREAHGPSGIDRPRPIRRRLRQVLSLTALASLLMAVVPWAAFAQVRSSTSLLAALAKS